MHITRLPSEITSIILSEAAAINEREGVAWTYGLSHSTDPNQRDRLVRSVRGPVSADVRRWDSTSSIRRVCHAWHDWAVKHALRDIYLRRWRGSERWAELPVSRSKYDAYELIDRPSGCAVYRDPYCSLRDTLDLFGDYPELTGNVQRMWFNSFHTPEAESLVFGVLRCCRRLTNISVPWTMLRHGTSSDWMHLLGLATSDSVPLQSLELQAVCLPSAMKYSPEVAVDHQPLMHPAVDFRHLKRLKLVGNTTFMPVCDRDLECIARTANNLDEFHVTCLSTVSIAGVMAIVKGAQQTLRVLDHSPRSDDGFYHPDPGVLAPGDHACEILAACPQLRDVSISIPSMCSHLFSNELVKWDGEMQVRALRLCPTSSGPQARPTVKSSKVDAVHLKALLEAARSLAQARARHRTTLDIELFFADCIFDPVDLHVHGDFAAAEVESHGHWPSAKIGSGKGPYGSTGFYGKDDGPWDLVNEAEWFSAIEGGWIRI